MTQTYGVVTDGTHSPSIGRDDSSITTTWRPFCNCGWSGIVIFTPFEIEDLQETLQKFAKDHGTDAVLPADAIFGDENDALIQILKHLNYDPAEDRRIAESKLDSAVSVLKNYDEGSSGAHGLYDLADSFPRIVEAVADQKHRSFVWETIKPPTLREKAVAIELSLRQHLINHWESRQIAADTGDTGE